MKLPKNSKWLLAVVALGVFLLANPSRLQSWLSPEKMGARIVAVLAVVVSYYVFGEKTAYIVAGVVAVLFLAQASREGMEVEGKAIEGTQCPPKFEFDVGAQMCKNAETGALVPPTQVVCASGYKPNETNDKCVQDKPAEAPAPPPPATPEGMQPPASSTGSKSAETAAPAKSTEGFEGKGTIATTPGEAQKKAKDTVVLQKQESTIESFGNWGAGYPLQ